MKCCVDGCDRDAMYKRDRLCQMHYFRRMRNGSFELKEKTRIYRRSNMVGYQLIFEPKHPLSMKDGYIYEHRFVFYNERNNNPTNCDMCGAEIDWASLHIDHIDNDITNNSPSNLRALCRSCNVFQGHTPLSMGKLFLTINGVTMTATAWSRQPGVEVSSSTIKLRKLKGYSDYDCIYAERKTHRNTKTKKLNRKYDEIRGITAVQTEAD